VEVVDGIAVLALRGVGLCSLLGDALGHDVFRDGLDEAVAVAEEPVDRRRMNTGVCSDAAGGDRVWPVVVQKPGGGLDDRRPGV
jgi:hypothetical protein